MTEIKEILLDSKAPNGKKKTTDYVWTCPNCVNENSFKAAFPWEDVKIPCQYCFSRVILVNKVKLNDGKNEKSIQIALTVQEI